MQRVQGSARQVSADKEGSPRRGSRVTELLTLGVSGSVTLTCFPASWSTPPSFFGPSVWPGGFFAGDPGAFFKLRFYFLHETPLMLPG